MKSNIKFFAAGFGIVSALFLSNCGNPTANVSEDASESSTETSSWQIQVDTILTGLNSAWGMSFLPDGSFFVTDRDGQMYLIKDGVKSEPISGIPAVASGDQAGLFDVEIHPNYADNKWVYVSYAYPKEGDHPASTALIRGKYDAESNALVDIEELYRGEQEPLKDNKNYHFGARITFDGMGHFFFSVGERGDWDLAQPMNNSYGKVHRFNEDGSIPEDNPFIGQEDIVSSIWSYGHRNPQGLVWDHEKQLLWEVEHGPQGGDEINISEPGKNYGWPEISYGINYDNSIITEDTVKAGMEQPLHFYRPSIAPCGLTVLNSDKYPGWEGSLLMGSLKFMYLERIKLEDGKVVEQEKLLDEVGRVRDVVLDRDGYIYVSTEFPGRVFRLTPVQ